MNNEQKLLEMQWAHVRGRPQREEGGGRKKEEQKAKKEHGKG